MHFFIYSKILGHVPPVPQVPPVPRFLRLGRGIRFLSSYQSVQYNPPGSLSDGQTSCKLSPGVQIQRIISLQFCGNLVTGVILATDGRGKAKVPFGEGVGLLNVAVVKLEGSKSQSKFS